MNTITNYEAYWVSAQKTLEKQRSQIAAKRIQASTKQMHAEEFRRALKKYDKEFSKLTEEAEERRKIATEKWLERKEREKRINEIRGLIAHYRRKLAFNPNDSKAQAMVSELENKLYWLMFGL